MRPSQVVGLFPELGAPGGIQRAGTHVAAVLTELAAELGVPCRLFSLNDPAGSHGLEVGGTEFRYRGFGRAKVRFTAAALGRGGKGAALVVAAHPHLAPVAHGVRVLRPGSQVVVMSHGIEVWRPLPLSRRLPLRRAHVVVAPSTDTAAKLVSVQGVLPHRVRRVAWGLGPEFVRRAEEGGPMPAGYPVPAARSLLTVARLDASERYKGVDSLIQAMPLLLQEVPDAMLYVVGDGDDRPRLTELALRLGVADHVHFVGVVPGEALRAYYRGCDVFAMPSWGEGFGLVFLEAMSMGKPVIAGAHGGSADIVEEGTTGFLVRDGDLHDLARSMRRLLVDDALRERLGAHALRHVRGNYLYEHFKERMSRVLAEACGF